MLALLKKDLYILINNFKSISISLILVIVISLYSENDIYSMLPFMLTIMSISTFSYDDFNNWHCYGASLPNGRKNYVTSKYLCMISLALLSSILTFVIAFIFNKNIILKDVLMELVGGIIATILVISITCPFMFKYGAEKGRTFLTVVILVGCAIIALLANIIHIDLSFIESFMQYGWIIIVLLIAAMFISSYFISMKIYLKKEL